MPRDELKTFFAPRSIAIVGVSRAEYVFGGTSFLLKFQEAGFPGRLYPVNPEADEICGIKAYPSLSSLPEVPDLVMVCIAAPHVPTLLEECGRIGARHIHILTSGFNELGTEQGRLLEQRIASIAREKGLWSRRTWSWSTPRTSLRTNAPSTWRSGRPERISPSQEAPKWTSWH